MYMLYSCVWWSGWRVCVRGGLSLSLSCRDFRVRAECKRFKPEDDAGPALLIQAG